jgi:hypothetical protein
MELKYKDIRDAIYRLKAVQFALNNEYEQNEGEVTQSTIDKEEMIDTIKFMLENGGTDKLARVLNSVDADIEQYKNEQEYLKRQQRKCENFREDILECIDIALRALGKDKLKGDFGYSFTQHIASSTKPDQKLIRELFYKDVEKAIREAHVCPEHITFTLSASCNLLKEGEDMPDYFTTTSKSRATFRKPRHVDNTPEEFTENDFQ